MKIWVKHLGKFITSMLPLDTISLWKSICVFRSDANTCTIRCMTVCMKPSFEDMLIQYIFCCRCISRSNFPQLASQGSWGSKNVPMKGNSSGSLSHQKSGSSKPTERLLSSSPVSSQSSLKLKKDVMTRNSGKDCLYLF